jgi:peptidoglycan/xylan/chitin deacetylase (PgdA/CDA1 family)/GT2 family glycosyltransferase
MMAAGNSPRVSIVTAARNAENTLGRMFESVARQTIADWQHIVCVGPSNDATESITRRWAGKDPRIKVVQTEARTAGAARNAALASASGHYVLFLDADDTISRKHCASLLASATRTGAHAVASGYRRLAADGRIIVSHNIPDLDDNAAEVIANGPITALHAMLFRREILEKVGGFDHKLKTNEDWDLCRKIVASGGRFATSKGASANYWNSAGSLTTDTAVMLQDSISVAKRCSGKCSAASHIAGFAAACQCAPDIANIALRTALWNGVAGLARGEKLTPILNQLRSISPLPPAAVDTDRMVAALLDGFVVGFGCAYLEVEERAAPLWMSLASFLRDVADICDDEGLDFVLLRDLEAELARIGPASPRRMIGSSLVVPLDSRMFAPLRLENGPAQVILKAPVVRPRSRGVIRFAPSQADTERPAKLIARRVATWLDARPRYAESKFAPWRDRGARSLILGRRVLRGMHRTARSSAAPDPNAADLQGSDPWETIFASEDPWNYHRAYEQLKYDRTLALIPDGPIGRALELACAEGLFTQRLAPRVGQLVAADISNTALDRARRRCDEAGLTNIDYRQIDFFNESFGSGWDLIVCSEVLYYMHSSAAVGEFASRVAAGLNDNGRFLHAHAYEVSDSPERTGFDWGDNFAAATISAAFAHEAGLVCEHLVETELYRIELYRKVGKSDAALRTPIKEDLSARDGLEPELAADVVWNGAVTTREAAEKERCYRIPVLLYHSIGTDAPEGLAPWQVSPAAFEHHLRFLRRRGYRSITLDEWDKARGHSGAVSGRPVLITFDDGLQDFADTAWPILKRNGFGAHVFVVAGNVGKTADWDAHYGRSAPLMGWDTLLDVVGEGVTIGSHMHRHLPINRLTFEEVSAEADRSRQILSDKLAIDVNSLAPPFGICDPARIELFANAGYRWIFGADGDLAPVASRPGGRIPRIEIGASASIEAFAQLVRASDPPTGDDLP